MEHYITEIRIERLRHLSDIIISLNAEQRQHLIVTGKNGSGKTSLLMALEKYLQAINEKQFNDLIEYPAIIIDGYGLRKNLFQGIRLPCIEAGIDSFPSFCSNLSLRVSFGTGVG